MADVSADIVQLRQTVATLGAPSDLKMANGDLCKKLIRCKLKILLTKLNYLVDANTNPNVSYQGQTFTTHW